MGGVTEVWLTRPLVTNDSQDRPITAGSVRIVWSWGDGTDTVTGHGAHRGTTKTTFMGVTESDTFPAYDGKWTMQMDSYLVPHSRITTYACQSFSFPTDADRHVIAFRPVNVSKFNHHAIVHICQDNSYFALHDSPQLCSLNHGGEQCPGNNCGGASPLGENTAGCSGLIWSWAVGMGDFVLPPEAGLRTGSVHALATALPLLQSRPPPIPYAAILLCSWRFLSRMHLHALMLMRFALALYTCAPPAASISGNWQDL